MLVRTVVFVVAIAALLGALFWSQSRPAAAHVSGFVEADEIRVGSRIGGRVQQVLVEEGQPVEPGDLLVVLEPFDLRGRRAEAEARLRLREAELALLRAGFRAEEIAQAAAARDQLAADLDALVQGPRPREIEIARARVQLEQAQLDLARAEHERIATLHARSVASTEDLERAVRALKVAQAAVMVSEETLALLLEGTRVEEVAAARAQVEQADQAWRLKLSGARPEEIARAQADVAAAQASLATVEQQLAETEIRAPVAGVVEAVDLQPGDLVAPNAPVLSLLDPTELWVRAYVPENRLSLRPGRQVPVSVDAFPGRRFQGAVSFIARQAEFTPANVQTPEERSEQVFRIRVVLQEGLDLLRPGMSADVWLEPQASR